MSSIYHGTVSISIFGQSHGPAVGMVLDGVEPGVPVDMQKIRRQMKRRAPGKALSTKRQEADEVEWLSGIYQETTTGSPIAAVIRNTNAQSGDYENLKAWMRPSHADYPASVRYKGYADMRGGGHFSGRLTAPLVLAGSLCCQALEQHIRFTAGSHIVKLGTYEESCWTDPDPALLRECQDLYLPCLHPQEVQAVIEKARQNLDSVGGIVETVVTGIPAGLGSPFFDSMESRLSSLLFSIPAVKGVSFGAGFDFASMTGSQANDPYTYSQGRVVTLSNHNGGILGGITTGMPIVFRTVIKPTASIGRPQHSVNLETKTDEVGTVKGRHDPCIVPRAIPVLEACAAICLYEAYKEEKAFHA